MSITFYVQDDLRQANSQFWGRIFGLSIQSGRKKKAYSVEEAARLAGMEWSAWLAVEAGCCPIQHNCIPCLTPSVSATTR
jgi:hypothetical protein